MTSALARSTPRRLAQIAAREGRWSMRLGTFVYALAFAATTLAGTVEAGVPTDQLRGATDRVLKVLQDSELKQPAKRDARRSGRTIARAR